MGNDIEIRVRVANDTATGLAGVNSSLRTLKNNARDAGQALNGLNTRAVAAAAGIRTLDSAVEGLNRSLRTLRGRAAAADAALRDLRSASTDASNSLRAFNTRAQTSDTRLANMSDRTRALRSDTDDLDDSMRRLTGTMSGLGGSLGTIRTSGNGAAGGVNGLRKAALLLSPALIPIAAAAVPIVANLGAATVAVGVFGAAIGRQVAAMGAAASADKKYREAIREHGGAGSREAAKAAHDLQQALANMSEPSREAAAGLMVLKETYRQWSDDLADSTMPVVTKSFATFGALLPRLAPTVRSTATELDRLMTVLAGGVNSKGFDAFMTKLSEFSSGVLSRATDGLVKFMHAMSTGSGSSGMSEFMTYVRDVGPQVGQTLSSLVGALAHLVNAASDTGLSLLTLVEAFAGLVNAIPTGMLSTLLQFAVAFKLIKVAAMGLAGGAGGMAAFSASLTAMSAASAAAGGGIAGLVAAFGALSKAAKFNLIAVGIGLAVVAFSKLSNLGQEAPPNVNKLTESLGKLAMTGQSTGEAARLFGKDLEDLYEKVRNITDPSTADQIQNGLVKVLTLGQFDSTPSKNAQTALDAIDDALVSLVQGGKADLAAAALARLSAEYSSGGANAEDFRNQMDEYQGALATQAYEQQLVAQSMGIFGEQALATSAKLDAQKRSADGLRESILALNDVNRSAYDAQIGFEASLDKLAESFKDNGSTLDLSTEKGRENAQAMSAAAKSQDELIASGLAAGESLASMTKKSGELRESMLRLATEAFDGNKAKAQEYVNTLLGAPGSIATIVKLEREEAITGLREVQAAIEATPGAKSVTVSTLNAAAIRALEAVGYKTRQLPNGQTMVYTANGQAIGAINAVSSAMNSLDGTSANTYVTTHYRITGSPNVPKGTYYGSTAGRSADGNIYGRAYADGGTEQHVAQIAQPTFRLWAEPETGGEAYIPLAQSKRGRSTAILEDVADRFGYRLEKFAKGGVTKSEAEARREAMGGLGVSRFAWMAGDRRSAFNSALARPDSVGSLVSALNQWAATIRKATHGALERNLLRALDSAGRKLITWEKQLVSVGKELEKAKSKLSDLKSASSQLAGSVRSGVLGSANITRGAGGEGLVTAGSIMGGLTASRDKATAFASALKQLQAKGLSSSLLRQVAEAGIEGGGLETAGALLGASSSEIASMNDLQSQIGKAAAAAGKTTADAVYAKQIQAQERLVKALGGQQTALLKSMDKLTGALEKLIEKGFKGKASGGIVGAATGGLRSGWTLVGEHEPELVRLPFGSRVYSGPDTRRLMGEAPWSSMLNTPRSGGPVRSTPVAAGRPEPVVIELRSSGNEVDEFLLKILRRAINNRGGNVQVVLSGRKQ